MSFQIDELCEASSDVEIRAVLQNLPEGLSETYERILGKLRHATTHTRILAQEIFKWVSCAKRPLDLDELREAIAIKPLQKSYKADEIPTNPNGLHLIQACRNLVVVDYYGKVRLAHHTVQQFLQAPDNETFADRFRFEAAIANTQLGTICLTYLSFTDFESQVIPLHKQEPVQLTALQHYGLLPISYLFGAQSFLMKAWVRLRGLPSTRKPLDLDFSQYVNKTPHARVF